MPPGPRLDAIGHPAPLAVREVPPELDAEEQLVLDRPEGGEHLCRVRVLPLPDHGTTVGGPPGFEGGAVTPFDEELPARHVRSKVGGPQGDLLIHGAASRSDWMQC